MQDLKAIAQIFETHGWEPVRTVVPLPGGNVNPCFDVNGRWIVRLNRRDPHLRKFRRESLAYERLKGVVPVPTVLGLDESRAIVDTDVLVVEKMPGASVMSYWATLAPLEQRDLAFRAGEALARIHKVEMEKPGPLEAPVNRTWMETLAFGLERDWSNALTRGYFPIDLDADLWRIFRALRPDFEAVKTMSLLHGDFHFGNIMGEGTQLTGLIDFEWSRAGDPDLDFCNSSNFQDSAAGSEALLIEGYRQARPEFEPGSRKLKFYTLLMILDLLNFEWEESWRQNFIRTFHTVFAALKDS